MREQRSPTQVLFSLLPQQTADIGGRIWKVDEWVHPVRLSVDPAGVRSRLLGAIDPWRVNGTDAELAKRLYAGDALEVVGVNRAQGVRTSLWPNNWVCQQCRRLSKTRGSCKCGNDRWGQFHFVAFHDCGYSQEPWIQPCPSHKQVQINSPRSSSVRDLIFSCPVCSRELLKGLGGGRPCPGCKQPGLSFNVHRAASVYSPHTFTMVNPARPEHLQALKLNGGEGKCLEWMLAGMQTARPGDLQPTRQSMIDSLVGQGMSQVVAEAATNVAYDAGALGDDTTLATSLAGERLELVQASAFEVALAMYQGRRSASHLQDDPVGPDLLALYRDSYPGALSTSGLAEVYHVDRFPILRGVFGFSRGGGTAGEKRLVGFRGDGGEIRIHADTNETEAFYLQLDPMRVARWLHKRGLIDVSPSDEVAARLLILEQADFPGRGDDVSVESIGSAVLTLVHTFAHRFIRQLAVRAGVDRESVAEYLVPDHLGAFIYATPRGEFVLGGLQSVFETDLDRLLEQQVDAETRCPLDPGCDRASGACLACLHIGEPSCSHYNRFLDRKTLFGAEGYLSAELHE